MYVSTSNTQKSDTKKGYRSSPLKYFERFLITQEYGLNSRRKHGMYKCT